jgi:hypothetical protein
MADVKQTTATTANPNSTSETTAPSTETTAPSVPTEGEQVRRRSSLDQSVIDLKEKEESFTQNIVRNDTLKGKKGPSGGLDLRKASIKKPSTAIKSSLPDDAVKEVAEDSAGESQPLSATPPQTKKETMGLGMEALALSHKEETYTSKIKKNDTLAKRRLSISKDGNGVFKK